MRPTPFQAYVRIKIGCDKFCTYCIVPERPRPRAEPAAASTSSPRSAQLADRRLQGNHAARPDGQQLQVHQAAAARTRLSDLLDALHDIAGIERHQVRHELSQGHDRRPARRRPRPAEGARTYLHVPAQSGCERRAASG